MYSGAIFIITGAVLYTLATNPDLEDEYKYGKLYGPILMGVGSPLILISVIMLIGTDSLSCPLCKGLLQLSFNFMCAPLMCCGEISHIVTLII